MFISKVNIPFIHLRNDGDWGLHNWTAVLPVMHLCRFSITCSSMEMCKTIHCLRKTLKSVCENCQTDLFTPHMCKNRAAILNLQRSGAYVGGVQVAAANSGGRELGARQRVQKGTSQVQNAEGCSRKPLAYREIE